MFGGPCVGKILDYNHCFIYNPNLFQDHFLFFLRSKFEQSVVLLPAIAEHKTKY